MTSLNHPVAAALLAAASALSSLSGAAWAADRLAVAPVPGHTVTKAAPDPGYTEAFEVASTLDADAGCQIQFQPAGATGATQAQLNAIAATPAYLDVVRQFLGLRFDVRTSAPVTLAGVRGVQVTGDAKGGAGVSMLATVLETPRGRTVVVCIAPTPRLDALRPEFTSVTQAVRLPD